MSSMGNGGAGVGWHVTGQQEQSQLDAAGRVQEGMRVIFQTDTGVTGSIFLPLALYTPDNVRAAIRERAAMIGAVTNLSGS